MKNWNIRDNSFYGYINACLEASSDEIRFNNFKRNNNYTAILEHQHIPKEYGDIMISHIESKYDRDKLEDKIDRIKENDRYGNPILYNFDHYGDISLGTLRYVKNSCDIVSYFGDDIKTIVEIGGGYGGLCKTISNFIEYNDYYIYDLEQVNLLSSKYLSKFDNYQKVHIQLLGDSKKFTEGEIDLLISNYAFSELPRSVQLRYLSEVVTKSKRFYMIYNHLQSEGGENGMTFDEFIDMMSVDYDISMVDDIDTDLVKIIYGKLKNK